MTARLRPWFLTAIVLTVGSAVYADAPPGRYRIDTFNGTASVDDDTVTDTRTGLVWQRAADVRTYTHAEALARCAGISIGTLTGFRLPTRKELMSIVDFSRTDPTIDPRVFPDTPLGNNTWTATLYTKGPGQAWVVDFLRGEQRAQTLDTPNYVRCVRSP